MSLAEVTLDDKYVRRDGRVYLTGSQALVRLAIVQAERDRDNGLNTACLVSGYRGSPMHNVDREFWRAGALVEANNIQFQPAVNEDLAATAIWGSQQAQLHGDNRYDGVFGLWYGKGPGLDRSVDAIRHANLAGASAHGGVLVAVGDDPAMMSTDTPATSEPTFVDLMMPVLYPASVQEILDYGQIGWAMSRYCGSWVGFKTVSDTVDTAASVDADPGRPNIVIPDDFKMPPGGLNIRLPDPWHDQEARQTAHKLAAARSFARANGINRALIQAPRTRLAIIASGKAALDAHQALHELGLDDQTAMQLGISLFKIGMPHPLDGHEIYAFTNGAEQVLVVEEKRRVVETQVKDLLYVLPEGSRPAVVGRGDENWNPLVSGRGELTPDDIAKAIAKRIAHFHTSDQMAARIAFLGQQEKAAREREALSVVRSATFCSGCPHNSSTKLPDGSRAHGGVGCHFMAVNMDRNTSNHTHMGGEGATWIGQAPFVETDHIFQNLGDGTYYHSGLLGIRASIAAATNITFKILFNDAVAMTGGQPHDGPLSPALISQQVYGEGVRRITLVSDEPKKYPKSEKFAPGVTFEHRKALDRVQRELREVPGVSVIIYDQTCAAEKRRRRKRGTMNDPVRRVFINEAVCEGCGDCNERSNCLSVLPLDTEYGRKRQIDQSSCNKDYSCADGFCPSFVSVIGGQPRRSVNRRLMPTNLEDWPEPTRPGLEPGRPYKILVTGVGGTGVATIGALLTMAAHLEGLGCAGVDQFGMAQKGGPVTSHVQIAAQPQDIKAVRLTSGAADLILACDKLVAGGELALGTIRPNETRIIVNTHEAITGQFTRDPDLQFPSEALAERLVAAAGRDQVEFVDATRIATALMGDSIAANLFMLGYAWQRGLIPLSPESIERAIELNGIAVDANIETFNMGCYAVIDPQTTTAIAEPDTTVDSLRLSENLDEMITRRVDQLRAYQSRRYARRYQQLVEAARSAEAERAPGQTGFAEAVARYGYKLMAYKDEYEVARLYSDSGFAERLTTQFEGDFKLQIHLAPPLLTRKDRDTGLPVKRTFGPWMLRVMGMLARFKILRGTKLDVFGYTQERRAERQLIAEYQATVSELIDGLHSDNHPLAVEIASIPESIRGYGYVKARNMGEAQLCRADLMTAWREPTVSVAAAAE
ncbi:MAG: indolepyruvate ferredoxin oxidoreductase family protein [Alphaproteobacteria bacterium]|nr:indolepyruvate ferredoxin oxidoreductase family protein [Alphaproteobacteria bacterium]